MGVLSAEDDATYSKMEHDLDSLTNEIKRMERRDAIEAELLNMEEGHPAIYKSGFMSDDNGEPVSCYRTTALSEHVRYATEMLAR